MLNNQRVVQKNCLGLTRCSRIHQNHPEPDFLGLLTVTPFWIFFLNGFYETLKRLWDNNPFLFLGDV
jgi:hypothetical protein